ncbi:Cysteine-rich secretory protein LCCL domain-containing 2 [Bagarius yarrelli]|uniref:Cysteine-rich secretory protein LCCL domain-containing 2 n=1 Tax=Bagarius yarrelli TaxID=175774 RepID=A0A556VUN9_BAGYA|nr:Cysteine-rich secretory protein LCCL domain-containing 2 [Bagarius yarrelli]
MFRLWSLALLLSATHLSSSLFLPDSPELRRLLSRYQNELETNVTASSPGSRVRRAIPWSDREEILLLHNKLRGDVYPTAANMEYMAWYDEVKHYTYPYPHECNPWCPDRCSGPMCTHYTQLVWATTNRVGCAVHVCSSMNVWGETWENAVYLVCNYSPKGNWIGEAPYQHGRPCSQCPPSYGGVCKDNLCYKGAPQRSETPDMNEVEKPQVLVQAEIPPSKPVSRSKPSPPKATRTNFLTQNIKCETKMRDKCKGATCNRYNCPANCLYSSAKVWGTLYYDVQSSICRAAIHYGVIDNNGGLVEITRKNNFPFFVKATKNGIESLSKHKMANAFLVAKVEIRSIDCYTRMADICPFSNQHTTCPRVKCPASCKNQPSYWAPVIGSGVYTDSSSICRAALHAGVLNPSGGSVDILAMDKRSSYTGSLKNGVQSESSGAKSQSALIMLLEIQLDVWTCENSRNVFHISVLRLWVSEDEDEAERPGLCYLQLCGFLPPTTLGGQDHGKAPGSWGREGDRSNGRWADVELVICA